MVEGKYDKIRLENIIDAVIIPTDGFSIFKNREKGQFIKLLAEKKGIIILTDSDSAGLMIRSHIKKLAANADVINVFVPQIKGKEKRKTKPGAEGILGVEGINDNIIKEAFSRFGVDSEKTDKKAQKITKTDLFEFGLSGGENSTKRRKYFLEYLNLPLNLPPNTLLDVLNSIYKYDEFIEVTKRWYQEEIRN